MKIEKSIPRKKELKLKIEELERNMDEVMGQLGRLKLGEDDAELMSKRNALSVRLASTNIKLGNLENHFSENGEDIGTTSLPKSTSQFK